MTTLQAMPDTGPGRPAADVLTWGRDEVAPVLRSAVAGMATPVRRIAGYHLGWWDEHGDPVDGEGGKALRPALALLSAQAVGGSATAALPAAAAVELVHNFSLLHDDVMDGDTTRRHRPTAWRVFGVPAAVLAGDGLLALAFQVITAAAGRSGAALLGAAVHELVDGQAVDLALQHRARVSVGECIEVATAKTGALLACACALGALLGGGRQREIEQLGGFGRQLGIAFQLVDDLLDIWGDPTRTGKPARSDLAQRRRTMPVVAALTSGTPAASELATLYQREPSASGDELARAAELVELAGGRRWAERQLADRLAQALARLSAANPVPPAAAELAAVAELMARRND